MVQKDFENIAASLRSRVISVARGYGLDADTVEDVAQDTLLKLWTIRDRYSGDKQATALGVTIAKHLSVDVLRGRRCSQFDDVRISDSLYSQPDSKLESKENETWLKMQLDRLPTKEYSVLHLRQVERKTTEEIANIVGISPNSVPTLLARARKKLLEEIKKRG